MTNLQKLIEEVRDTGREYRDSTNKDAKRFYSEYIETIIIDEAQKDQQDFLFKYWEECKAYSSSVHKASGEDKK